MRGCDHTKAQGTSLGPAGERLGCARALPVEAEQRSVPNAQDGPVAPPCDGGCVIDGPASAPSDSTLPAETPASSLTVPSFRLHVMSGPDAGQSICSTSERVVVGTHPSCDLRLSDRLV